jgi:microsomal dipeptidase-like Zn-dependent dipeptidase
MTCETHNVAGFMHHSDFPAVAQAMFDHGYGEETVRKILGENRLRVFGQVWKRINAARAGSGNEAAAGAS